MTEKELEVLGKLFDEKFKAVFTELKDIRTDIKDLKTGQEEIKNMFQELEGKNANRHIETNLKLEELEELKQVTKENCYDIAKLKAIK